MGKIVKHKILSNEPFAGEAIFRRIKTQCGIRTTWHTIDVIHVEDSKVKCKRCYKNG